jgi:hypothetical protein
MVAIGSPALTLSPSVTVRVTDHADERGGDVAGVGLVGFLGGDPADRGSPQ